MNKYARYGIAAAAVVLVAVLAFNLIPKSGGVGGPGTSSSPPPASASPTQGPSPTPPPSASPSPAAIRLRTAGELAAGSYFFDDPSRTVISADRVTFTMPAGWTTTEGVFIAKHRDEPGEVLLVPWVVTHVFSNACQWEEDQVVQVETVDEIVAALEEQTGREASRPSGVTIGGVAAQRIELTVPPDLDVATCTNGNQRYWPGPGPDFSSGLCCNPAGNTDVVYVLDLPTSPMVVVTRHYPGSSEADRAELESIVQSMRFEF